MGTLDLSPMAVTVQAIGTLLLGLMLAQLGRVFARAYATRWALGFAALFLALFAVWSYTYTHQPATWSVYLVLEWAYLLMLWAGCRELATGIRPDLKYGLYALPLAIVSAVAMTHFAPSFDELFIVQSLIVAAGLAAAYRALSPAGGAQRGLGWWTMRTALLIQALLFASYAPLFAYHEHVAKLDILGYSSIADLMVSIFLGFGMIVVTAEETHRELNNALARLNETRSHLEVKLQTDPLTEALSRHAFYSMQRGDDVTTAGVLSGVVVMIDVDSLKVINDEIGHAAGDVVIRSSANAVRQLIRADDLLFRWGGDEFVAILPNSTMPLVAERLAPLADGIVAHVSEEHPELRFHVSWGGAEFGAQRSLDEAIRLADTAMYDTRKAEQGSEAVQKSSLSG